MTNYEVRKEQIGNDGWGHWSPNSNGELEEHRRRWQALSDEREQSEWDDDMQAFEMPSVARAGELLSVDTLILVSVMVFIIMLGIGIIMWR